LHVDNRPSAILPNDHLCALGLLTVHLELLQDAVRLSGAAERLQYLGFPVWEEKGGGMDTAVKTGTDRKTAMTDG